MKKLNSILFAIILLFTYNVQYADAKSKIQVALILDTSGSMDGLIEQAKTELWKVVNELAVAKKDNLAPDLEIALYEYGKDAIPASQGYLKMLVPLSTDLDLISEELFKLTTNGGQEYCGMVIKRSLDELKWSTDNGDLKMIFIAGNEPFTQGSVDYKKSCANAIAKGIVVNTIFCGNYQEGINTKWKDGADLSDGKYLNIDHNKVVAQISAPQDQELIKLNEQLNKTYIGYGTAGIKYKARQVQQDKNASNLSVAVMAERAVTKSSKKYSNSSWDIVDAYESAPESVEEMESDEMPDEMKDLDSEERVEYIKEKKEERDKIQAKIQRLNKERLEYIASERKKLAIDNTLDVVIIKAIHEQATTKRFKF